MTSEKNKALELQNQTQFVAIVKKYLIFLETVNLGRAPQAQERLFTAKSSSNFWKLLTETNLT